MAHIDWPASATPTGHPRSQARSSRDGCDWRECSDWAVASGLASGPASGLASGPASGLASGLASGPAVRLTAVQMGVLAAPQTVGPCQELQQKVAADEAEEIAVAAEADLLGS